MKTFTCTIKDSMGLHARPAGLLSRKVRNYQSKVILHHGTESAECKRMLAIMQMAIQPGEQICITVEGPDEAQAYQELKAYIEEIL